MAPSLLKMKVLPTLIVVVLIIATQGFETPVESFSMLFDDSIDVNDNDGVKPKGSCPIKDPTADFVEVVGDYQLYELKLTQTTIKALMSEYYNSPVWIQHYPQKRGPSGKRAKAWYGYFLNDSGKKDFWFGSKGSFTTYNKRYPKGNNDPSALHRGHCAARGDFNADAECVAHVMNRVPQIKNTEMVPRAWGHCVEGPIQDLWRTKDLQGAMRVSTWTNYPADDQIEWVEPDGNLHEGLKTEVAVPAQMCKLVELVDDSEAMLDWAVACQDNDRGKAVLYNFSQDQEMIMDNPGISDPSIYGETSGELLDGLLWVQPTKCA